MQQYKETFIKTGMLQALHFSSGRAPQIPHDPPSSCINGLLLLQVPENFPSFFTNILMAIPAMAMANSTMASRIIFIPKFTEISKNPVGPV